MPTGSKTRKRMPAGPFKRMFTGPPYQQEQQPRRRREAAEGGGGGGAAEAAEAAEAAAAATALTFVSFFCCVFRWFIFPSGFVFLRTDANYL